MQSQNVIAKQGKFEHCRWRNTEDKIAAISKTISFRYPRVIFLLIKGIHCVLWLFPIEFM